MSAQASVPPLQAELSAGVGVALDVRDVQKRYGHRPALRGVDLRLLAGKTLAIVGPNGAGKTTLLRVLATLARPSAGTMRICGYDAVADAVPARRQLGVVLGTPLLYPEMTGRENLAYYARLYGLPDANRRILDVAEAVGIGDRLDDRVSVYSRGMAQRLSIARALLHRPAVLLLDEPDAGLDPSAAGELPRLLRADGASERAIVLTCHDLRLALTLADDVAILVGGRFAFAAPTASLTPDALRAAYDRACGLVE